MPGVVEPEMAINGETVAPRKQVNGAHDANAADGDSAATAMLRSRPMAQRRMLRPQLGLFRNQKTPKKRRRNQRSRNAKFSSTKLVTMLKANESLKH